MKQKSILINTRLKNKKTSPETIFPNLKKENGVLSNHFFSAKEDNHHHDITALLNELQIAHLELEMQNDELFHNSEQLKIEREKFEELFNLAPLGYFILDKFGVIEQANKAGQELLGNAKIFQIPTRFQSFIAPDDWEIFYQFLRNMQTLDGKQSQEIKLLLKNGTCYIRMDGIATCSKDSDQLQYYIAAIDISESKLIQQDHQRLILSTTFSAQERERDKISSALHDSVCQLLYGIKLNLQNTQLPNALKDEFKSINQLLDQAIAETRALSYDLTPSVLRDFGFTAGVNEIAQRLSTSSFKILTKLKSDIDHLTPGLQLFIFRIMQELINNCIKHANASEAEITVSVNGEEVTLVVADNGSGFTASLENSITKGSGLRGVKNRIFLMDGSLGIKTSKKGTIVTVTFKRNEKLDELTMD